MFKSIQRFWWIVFVCCRAEDVPPRIFSTPIVSTCCWLLGPAEERFSRCPALVLISSLARNCTLTQDHTRTQDNIISPPNSQMKFGFFYEVHKNRARNSGPTTQIFGLLVRHKCEKLYTHKNRKYLCLKKKMLWVARVPLHYWRMLRI